MREIVIVIADLYLPDEPGSPAAPGGNPAGSDAMPGLAHAARFGERTVLEHGWRSWLARWLGREDLAEAAPASVAAAAFGGGAAINGIADREVTDSGSSTTQSPSPAVTAWIATPVHLVAGLTSLHLDRRSILRPPRAELTRLASDFRHTFDDSGFRLAPLDSGEFLMVGPAVPQTETTEPARSMGSSIAEALPSGAGSAPLRRLGAEIEMWLHEHPVNVARTHRGEAVVSALWFWGGGPADLAADRGAPAAVTTLGFGTDPYLRGLWHLTGGESLPQPEQLDALFGYPQAHRAVLVLEVGQVLQSDPKWSLFDAMAEIDRRSISPALEALRRGDVERVVLVANDRRVVVRSWDRLRLWRRPRAGLEGLQ